MTPKYLTIRQNKWSAKRIEIKFCSSSSDSRRNCSNQLIIITGVIASLSIPNMHFINSGCMKRKTKQNSRLLLDNFFFFFLVVCLIVSYRCLVYRCFVTVVIIFQLS